MSIGGRLYTTRAITFGIFIFIVVVDSYLEYHHGITVPVPVTCHENTKTVPGTHIILSSFNRKGKRVDVRRARFVTTKDDDDEWQQ